MLDFEQWADQAISIVSGDAPPASPGRDGPAAVPSAETEAPNTAGEPPPDRDH
jgi:hypothetical protein